MGCRARVVTSHPSHPLDPPLQIVPCSMLPLVSGTNSRLPSVNHALISPILHHPVLWVALIWRGEERGTGEDGKEEVRSLKKAKGGCCLLYHLKLCSITRLPAVINWCSSVKFVLPLVELSAIAWRRRHPQKRKFITSQLARRGRIHSQG